MALKDALDGLLNAATAKGEVPGVVGMITDRSDTLYQGAFGRRVLGQDAPMTVDTVGLIASMSKAITATAAMQLVERGKLDLESPASRWLRLPALYLTSRRVPAALGLLAALGGLLWAALHWRWNIAGGPAAKEFFATLRGVRRYSFIYRIADAKRPETRERRIREFVAMLAEGRTHH